MAFFKQPNTRTRRSQAKLSYVALESRTMLSADLNPARSLVVGGDFEDQGASAFIAFANGDEADLQDIRIVEATTPRSRFVELDSVAGQRDSIAQNLVTLPGQQYVITFDLRGRPLSAGDDANSNEVEVLFGGQSAGRFNGVDKWQTFSVSATASGNLTQLEFRETSTASDGKGILLDHIGVAGVRESFVTNGSIEEINADNSSGVVASDAVPGFHAVTQNGQPVIGVRTVADASDGVNVLNLNTSDSRLDTVFLNVRTEAWSTYFVTFELRNGDATDSEPANLRVRWNSDFAGSFFGSEEWQRHGIVLQATSGFSTLVLREAGGSTGSGIGPQLDNVRIYRIDSIGSDFSLDLNGPQPGTGNTATFVENGEANLTSSNLALNFSHGSILSSATVRILNFAGTELLQGTTDGTGIQQQFDISTGILRLVGRSSVANYQNVLRSLTYTDSSDNPTAGTKRILVSVTDGSATSERSEVALTVIAVNDAPMATALADIDAPLHEPLSVNVVVMDPDDTEFTYSISVADSANIFSGQLPTISATGQIQLTAVREGTATISVVVTDTAGLQSEFSFDVTAQFQLPSGPIPNNFAPFSGQRQLSGTSPALRNGIYDAAPPFTINTSLNYQAVIETADGDIRFDLFEQQSPLTVNNFVNLAQDGFFDGLTFHRVLANFVAQGGDPAGTGSGGPGYQFADELNNGLEFDGFGQLAMANSGPNTNGSQFFFTLNDNPAFAGQHTIFGRVIAGEDVLRAVNLSNTGQVEVIRRVRIEFV